MTRKKGSVSGELCCSFCGKNQDEVQRLIAGPDVYICDECVALCNEIIAQESVSEETEGGKLLPPAEIKPVVANIDQALEASGLVMVETSADKARQVQAAVVENEVPRPRRTRPAPVVISDEPLVLVETRNK